MNTIQKLMALGITDVIELTNTSILHLNIKVVGEL